MKVKEGFILRDVGGKTFVVAVGETSKKFQGMITLNETARSIWEYLSSDTTVSEIVDKMAKEYDAPRDVIEKDVCTFVNKLKEENILE